MIYMKEAIIYRGKMKDSLRPVMIEDGQRIKNKNKQFIRKDVKNKLTTDEDGTKTIEK